MVEENELQEKDGYKPSAPVPAYVAVHKEFDRNHEVISTIVFPYGEQSEGYEKCLAWCKKANKNGFNYKPYLKLEIKGL